MTDLHMLCVKKFHENSGRTEQSGVRTAEVCKDRGTSGSAGGFLRGGSRGRGVVVIGVHGGCPGGRWPDAAERGAGLLRAAPRCGAARLLLSHLGGQ